MRRGDRLQWRSLWLFALLCAHRQPCLAQDGCPLGSHLLKTPTTAYCVCLAPRLCEGPMCKTARRLNNVMHGYPVDKCKGVCKCVKPTQAGDESPTTTTTLGQKHKLRAIFIKSYKVASTTVATIFQRLTEERGLKVASRYNAGVPMHPSGRGVYHIIYGHNFYTMGTKGGFPCSVKRLDDGSWTHCGGYQPWMDYYIQDAVHLVMVADPLERVASMYYYEAGYTKQKDRGPADTEYSRINNEARFTDPVGSDDTYIARFITDAEYYNKWERVQWWWLRECTTHRTVNETIQLLNDRFLVGLPRRLDESLLMWRASMGLATRDIIYTSMKASLSHPRVTAWSPANQKRARELVENNGDYAYYLAALSKFEQQAAQYPGGPAALSRDATRLGELLQRLRSKCIEYVVENEQLHVPDQVYCMLRFYDVAYENEETISQDLGCFSSLQTSAGRMRQMLFSSELTVSACRRRCLKGTDEQSFDVFALAYGSHCYCGTGDPPTDAEVPKTQCSLSCGGNPQKMCGGTTAYSIHRVLPRGRDWTDSVITGSSLSD